MAGFLTAALLALLVAPAISRRAWRLATARARLQSPLSETQARAERDALRGQHAIETTRWERRLEAAETDRAIHLVRLGRDASRIVALEDLCAERAAEIALQREELAATGGEIRDLNVQLASQNLAMRDLEFQRDDSRRDVALARSRILDLEITADENRAVVASLETRLSSLRVELSDSRRNLASVDAERMRLSAALGQGVAAADRLEEEFAPAGARPTQATREAEAVAARANLARLRLDEAETRLARSDAAREELALENVRQLERLAERDAAINRLEAANRDLARRLAALERQAAARRDAFDAQHQGSSISQAPTESSSPAARADRSELQKEVEQLRARLAEATTATQAVFRGDQALRQSIARLGREIARGREARDDDEPIAAQIVNFARREPNGAAGPSPESAHR